MNHYKWLDRNFEKFLSVIGDDKTVKNNKGIVAAHGDKCYSYKGIWEDQKIPFYHGVAMYLLTHIHPWSMYCRQTDHGFVHPHVWVSENYHKYKDILENIED